MGYLKWLDLEFCKYAHESPTTVRRRAYKLLQLFKPYANKILTPPLMAELLSGIKKSIGHPMARVVYCEEVKALADGVWTTQELSRAACCMAGGYVYAKEGQSLGITSVNWQPLDCLLRVKKVDVVEELGSKEQLRLTLVACNSRYAGDIVETTFGLDRLSRWSKLIGLHHYKKRVRCSNVKLFFGAHVIGRLERVDSITRLLCIACDPRTFKANQQLTLDRFRKYRKCEFGATFDCFACDVGFNECKYSCSHQQTNYFAGVLSGK